MNGVTYVSLAGSFDHCPALHERGSTRGEGMQSQKVKIFHHKSKKVNFHKMYHFKGVKF